MATYNITKIETMPNVLHVEYNFDAAGQNYEAQINFGTDYLTEKNGIQLWKSYLDDFVAKSIAWYETQKTPGASVSFEKYIGEHKI